MVAGAVEPGSIVDTDGWDGYNGLGVFERKRRVTVLGCKRGQRRDLLTRVHRMGSLVKQWMLATHCGRNSRKHFDCLLDEFTLRLDGRTPRPRGKLFFRLI